MTLHNGIRVGDKVICDFEDPKRPAAASQFVLLAAIGEERVVIITNDGRAFTVARCCVS